MKSALGDVGMKPGRLSVDVDQPILLARNNDDRHLQIRIFIPEMKSVRNHQRQIRRLMRGSAKDEGPFPSEML